MSMATASIPSFCPSVRVSQNPSRLDCLRSSATYSTRGRSRSFTSVKYLCPFRKAFSSTPSRLKGSASLRFSPRSTARSMIPWISSQLSPRCSPTAFWLAALSQKAVGEHLGLSWDEIHGIMERAVERGLNRREAEPLRRLGVDEKAFRKGHKYFTLVNDLDRPRVLYVAEDRKQSSLDGFWETLTEAQKKGIEAVAMAMCDPYVASVREHLVDGETKIVFDKFHVAKHLGDAVDKVRRKEQRILKAAGDDSLTGTRYDWLRNPAGMEPEDRKAFNKLRNSGLKTARAWALKETAMALFGYHYERPARKHFRWWHAWAVRSRLDPMIEVARTLKRRFENILTYLRHRITNAASESINAKIQWVKYTARGFRNKKNFQIAILFHRGGLNLAP